MLAPVGFAYRSTFLDFVHERKTLMTILGIKMEEEPKKATIQVLDKIGVPAAQRQAGQTKIFLRKEGWMMMDEYFKTAMQKFKPMVLKLEKLYRRYKFRKIVRLARMVAQSSRHSEYAIRIQKVFRGYLVRKRYRNQRADRRRVQVEQAAAIKIQKVFRGFIARTRLRKMNAKIIQARLETKSAIKIQKCFRGYLARKWFHREKARITHEQLEYRSAVKIQALVRGFLVRTSFAVFIEKIRKPRREAAAASTVQSVLRRNWVQYRLANILQAAYSLQRLCWTPLLRHNFIDISSAAVVIQAWWRGDRVRRILQEELAILLITSENMYPSPSWRTKGCRGPAMNVYAQKFSHPNVRRNKKVLY